MINLFPGLTKAADLAQQGLELDAFGKDVKAPKNGPERVRHLSAGRVESRLRRRKAAEKRKTNVSYRRRWMADQRLIATLRGQLESLDKAAEVVTGGALVYPDRVQPVIDDLVAKHGSVDAAYDTYAVYVAEQAA